MALWYALVQKQRLKPVVTKLFGPLALKKMSTAQMN
jgi:hypothetical protein